MNTQTQLKALDGRLLSTIRWSVSRCVAFVLDLLYPLACAGCGKVGEGVWCAACDARVPRLAPPEQLKSIPLDAPWQTRSLQVASGARYADPLREAIHAFKYEGTPALAAPLASLMLEAWRSAVWQADVLVPVPLHTRRRRERGYNQSELLALQLSAACGVPVDARLLARVRYTNQQALLKGAARKQNVQGAFACGPGANGKLIVLVDDVFTSGSTLLACAGALLSAGAAGVRAVTLARAE
jgi:ComF family protein